jgi:hypothetical protein
MQIFLGDSEIVQIASRIKPALFSRLNSNYGLHLGGDGNAVLAGSTPVSIMAGDER